VWHVNSTWAFLLGCEGRVVSYDIKTNNYIRRALKICEEDGLDWTFVQADDLKAKIEPTDMLFIDSLHRGEHLRKELSIHSYNVRKYIVMHDTEEFANKGIHNRGEGLWPVIEEFVAQGVWKIKRHYIHCHGLTVLKRV
jgi:hypothetical protein